MNGSLWVAIGGLAVAALGAMMAVAGVLLRLGAMAEKLDRMQRSDDNFGTRLGSLEQRFGITEHEVKAMGRNAGAPC